jgi:uncharacterized protein YrrD
MNKVELKEGTSVVTADGKEVGKVNRFVLDPGTNEVTHIVVQKGWLFTEDKVVPFGKISSATEDKVVLSDNIGDFDQLPPFEETHYVEVDDGEPGVTSNPATRASGYRGGRGYYWYPPYGYIGYPAYGLGYYSWPLTETQQNIPENTVPLQEGARVVTSDNDHVGNVERLLVNEATNKVTQFLISQGILFKDVKRVPANWIRSVTEDEVKLSVPSSVLERLPAYES